MSEQLEIGLAFGGGGVWAAQGRAFLALLRDVVQVRGLKQVAFDLDVQPSFLAHALAGRKRCYLRADWIPALIAMAPDDAPLEALARLRNRDLVPAKPASPEEQLSALTDALEHHLGEELRDAILATARKYQRR